ncbi:hypothetical protein C7M84_011908 [Penaeus vannamei]|uniref:Uncharacterized protein n=1 Tax=Penaeus vannamei TaxID=6689 RepID=A0A3R7QJY0_PENVA|nr:hypothetical protein C7M84_011908 [Penaeus vannamei]
MLRDALLAAHSPVTDARQKHQTCPPTTLPRPPPDGSAGRERTETRRTRTLRTDDSAGPNFCWTSTLETSAGTETLQDRGLCWTRLCRASETLQAETLLDSRLCRTRLCRAETLVGPEDSAGLETLWTTLRWSGETLLDRDSGWTENSAGPRLLPDRDLLTETRLDGTLADRDFADQTLPDRGLCLTALRTHCYRTETLPDRDLYRTETLPDETLPDPRLCWTRRSADETLLDRDSTGPRLCRTETLPDRDSAGPRLYRIETLLERDSAGPDCLRPRLFYRPRLCRTDDSTGSRLCRTETLLDRDSAGPTTLPDRDSADRDSTSRDLTRLCRTETLPDRDSAGPRLCWTETLLDERPRPRLCWTETLPDRDSAGPRLCRTRLLLTETLLTRDSDRDSAGPETLPGPRLCRIGDIRSRGLCRPGPRLCRTRTLLATADSTATETLPTETLRTRLADRELCWTRLCHGPDDDLPDRDSCRTRRPRTLPDRRLYRIEDSAETETLLDRDSADQTRSRSTDK